MTLTDTPHQVQAPPPTPIGKRRRFRRLAWALLLPAAVALLVVGGLRSGRPVALAQAAGTVRQVAATPQGVYWIEDAPGGAGSRLLFLDRVGGQPQVLAQGGAFVAFTLDDQHIVLLDAGAAAPSVHSPRPDGRLVRVPRAGGSPETIAEGLRNPAGLWVDTTGIYWTETYPPQAPAVPHVPAMGYVSLLRMLPTTGGTHRLVARLEGTGPQFAGQLLGQQEGEFVWLEPRSARGELGITLTRSIPLGAGIASTRWTAEGVSRGCLTPDGICATDVSTEASPAGMYVSVHRYPSGGAGNRVGRGERVLLTDWLDCRGWLLARGKSIYYVSERLWRVPPAQDWSVPVAKDLRYPAAADIGGGFLYCARATPAVEGAPGKPGAAPRPPSEELVRWPLTWPARLRSLLRLR